MQLNIIYVSDRTVEPKKYILNVLRLKGRTVRTYYPERQLKHHDVELVGRGRGRPMRSSVM